MILQQLKAYIEQQGMASRQDLAKKFSLTQDGVDAMLQVWVKKGRLSRMVDLDKQQQVRQVRYKAVSSNDIQLTAFMSR